MQIKIEIVETFTDLAAFARFAAACEILKSDGPALPVVETRKLAVTVPLANKEAENAENLAINSEAPKPEIISDNGAPVPSHDASAGSAAASGTEISSAPADDAAPAAKPRRKRRTKAEMEAARAAEAAALEAAKNGQELPAGDDALQSAKQAEDDWLAPPAPKPAETAPATQKPVAEAPKTQVSGDFPSDPEQGRAVCREKLAAALGVEDGETKAVAVFQKHGCTSIRDADPSKLPGIAADLAAIA